MQSSVFDVASTLRTLAATFQLNSVELATLLRCDDDYPSSGLVRTMMQGKQTPSERFAQVLAERKAELDKEVEEGVQALMIAGRLRRVFRVTPARHIITLLKADEFDLDHASPDDITAIVRAAESVPAMWVHRCTICGGVFVARTSRQRVCRRQDERGRYACRMEADRRYHADRYVKVRPAPKRGRPRRGTV